MIKIKAVWNKSNLCIRVTGHANYDVMGKDIVCSAVSALLQTLCYSLEELTADDVESSLMSGDSRLIIHEPNEKSRLLIDSFFIGCREIANSYPDHVSVIDAR